MSFSRLPQRCEKMVCVTMARVEPVKLQMFESQIRYQQRTSQGVIAVMPSIIGTQFFFVVRVFNERVRAPKVRNTIQTTQSLSLCHGSTNDFAVGSRGGALCGSSGVTIISYPSLPIPHFSIKNKIPALRAAFVLKMRKKKAEPLHKVGCHTKDTGSCLECTCKFATRSPCFFLL